jgi:hypothetical protein
LTIIDPVLCETTCVSRVDLPLICRRDKRPVGTLTIIRMNHAAFVDAAGHPRPNPVPLDTLLTSLKDAKGEEVTYLQVPLELLPPEPVP